MSTQPSSRSIFCALALAVILAAPIALAGERDSDAHAQGCPLRFDRHTVGLPKTCLFVGRYNGSCGHPAVAVFAGNGDTVVVGLAFDQSSDPTYFAGDVVSATKGSLAVWQQSPRVPAASTVAGSVTLEETGNLLRVSVDKAPFRVEGCQFGEFVGHFVEMVDAAPELPTGSLPDLSSATTRPSLTVN
jgi:hypothetical protein